jgi:succinyl-CoA synthetase beta subunit
MNLHEYQGKRLFKSYGLPVSEGIAAATVEEAVAAADKIKGGKWVVKAQVHAGGRGKAGGVKLVSSKDEIEAFAKSMLGTRLVTYQTDKNGQPVSRILVEPVTDIDKEFYLGAVVDRGTLRTCKTLANDFGVFIN